MIDDLIRKEIMERLASTEKEFDVKILMAIESGSRAWGFASPNSDYDVRFIYAHKADWYLSIDLEDKRDVIEYPIVDEIDLNGWDIRKALKLFYKSNPAFVEWIQSPITYIDDGIFRDKALQLLPEIYSPEKGIYHYRSMATTGYRGYLSKDIVSLKKYFYVLRALFSIQWIEKHRTAAPIEFEKVLALATDSEVVDAIHSLLEKKKLSEEKMVAPAVPVLNNFIEVQLARLDKLTLSATRNDQALKLLNDVFRSTIGQ